MNKKNNYILNTYKLLKLDRTDIANVYFYAIAAGLISLGLPLGIQAIIGFVMASQLSTSLILLIAVVVLATFFYGFFQINQLKLIEKVKQKIFIRFSLAFDEKLDKLDVQRNKEYDLSELMNRFFDTLTFQKSLSKLLIDIPSSTIQILLGLLLLAFYHPLFILFGLFLLVTLYLMIRFTGAQGMKSSIEESNYKYELVNWIEQQADYIKEVRSGDFDSLKKSKTNKILVDYTSARNKHFKILNIQYWSLTLFKVVLTAVMLIVGSYLLIEQLINIGQFVAAEIVIILLLSAIEKMIFGLDNAYDLLTATKKLFDVIDLPENKVKKAVSDERIDGNTFNCEGISLEAENGHQILKNISFSVSKGDICCLTGKSGSGKSSLINVMAGIYPDYKGRILIDDIILNEDFGARSSDHVGVSYLESGLLETNVMENITLNRDSIRPKHVVEVSKKLGFHDEIINLKNAYQTIVAPHKGNIPRQVQKMILLLRLLVRDIPVYMFEEPFSELQEQHIQGLINYWKNELNHRIIIYSTHSSQQEQFASKQLLLVNGEVAFFGTKNKIN
jgi:ABC-type bacteriocin/lantibiotic exporter with double-glycine peptidase domain